MSERAQEEIQRLYTEYVFLRQVAEVLNRNLVLLNNLLAETRLTREVIKEIEKLPDSSEIIVTISGPVFLKTRLLQKNVVLVNVGSDIIVEKSYNEALEYLENREKSLETELERTRNSYVQVVNRMRQLERVLRELAEKR